MYPLLCHIWTWVTDSITLKLDVNKKLNSKQKFRKKSIFLAIRNFQKFQNIRVSKCSDSEPRKTIKFCCVIFFPRFEIWPQNWEFYIIFKMGETNDVYKISIYFYIKPQIYNCFRLYQLSDVLLILLVSIAQILCRFRSVGTLNIFRNPKKILRDDFKIIFSP